MNASRVVMIDVLLKNDALLPFIIRTSGHFAFQTTEVLKELRRISRDMTSMISVDQTLGVSVSGKKVFQHFKFPLVSTEEEKTATPNIPKQDLVYAIIETKSLLDILRTIGERNYFVFESKRETLLLTRGETSNYYARITRDHDALMDLKISTTDQKSHYSTSYLIELLSHTLGFNDYVDVEFSADQPLKVYFDTKEMAFQYWVAPRIEVE